MLKNNDIRNRWVDEFIDLEKLGISVGDFTDANYVPCEKSTPERPLPIPAYLGAGVFRSMAKREARGKWLSQFDSALDNKRTTQDALLNALKARIRGVKVGEVTG